MTDRPTTERTALILDSSEQLPEWFAKWCIIEGLEPTHVMRGEALPGIVFRSRPRVILIDGRGTAESTENALTICARLKRDSFSGIVPMAVLVPSDRFADAFAAGADEVLRESADASEAIVRMNALLRRSDRDTDVHPSTRLPGTREIGAELARRIDSRDKFAVCYADLDHFKEFNDRYSYYRGNQVIQLLARLLHDVVKGLCGEEGFVGHIGGDDFLYVVPIAAMPRVCDEVIRVFDELIPLQYSAHDQRVGYFFGKDRRGQLHKVPLMTLSVGVVTNQRRRFVRASEVSELATEMKSYAKTLPGSLWVVDRRRDEPAASTHSASGSTVNDTGKGVSARTDAPSNRSANRSSAR
ncbi:MAG: diguanylate cyclase [Gemmatimonadaceae bacterium]